MITPLGWLERVPTYKEQQEQSERQGPDHLWVPRISAAAVGGHSDLPGGFCAGGPGPGGARGTDPGSGPAVQSIYPGAGYIPPTHAHLKESLVAENARQDLTRGVQPILPEPQVLLTPSPKLPGTDGRKMSKSYNNTILLTDPEPVIRQKLKTMVTDPARVRRTDPGDPDKCPVGDLHKVFSTPETLAKVYAGCRTAGIGCIECKGWAAESHCARTDAHPGAAREIRGAARRWCMTFCAMARCARGSGLSETMAAGERGDAPAAGSYAMFGDSAMTDDRAPEQNAQPQSASSKDEPAKPARRKNEWRALRPFQSWWARCTTGRSTCCST